jgi:hypothetical protein
VLWLISEKKKTSVRQTKQTEEQDRSPNIIDIMNEDTVRLEKAIDLYEQGASKENTGLMRDAIILYRAALKVSTLLLL